MKDRFDDLVTEDREGSPWKKGLVLYVDVDDTLIDKHDQVKPNTLAFLHYAVGRGCVLYLWSQGGGDYCESTAERLNIKHLFAGFLPKPDVALDDLEIMTRFIKQHFHPIQLVGIDW